MAGKKEAEWGGCIISVEPADLLHRLGWPFYFENGRYTFNVTIYRIGEETPHQPITGRDNLFYLMQPSDQRMHVQRFPLPNLEVGEVDVFDIPEVTSTPGLVEIRLDLPTETVTSDCFGIPCSRKSDY